jgi:membrane protease YdiL (CAAX protease family)
MIRLWIGMGLRKRLLLPVMAVLAPLVLGVLFLPERITGETFWYAMAANIAVLVILVGILEPSFRRSVGRDFQRAIPRKLVIGAVSAVVLYAVFYGGNWLSRKLFPGADAGIQAVYRLKEGVPVRTIVLLLVLVIGPGEELFWRGFIQRGLAARFGAIPGLLLATALYAGLHAASGNPMMLVAAAVCGLFWGWLYVRHHSVIVNILSHTLWDLAVFVVYPLAA